MKIFIKNAKGKMSLSLTLRNIKRNLILIRLSPLIARMSLDSDFPSSAGTIKQHLELTLRGSLETPFLLETLSKFGVDQSETKIIDIENEFEFNNETQNLRNLLDKNGSDKGTYHNYDLVYSYLLSNKLLDVRNILEIGLGTNNTDIISNMGATGTPGASLRSWRDYCPTADVVGCDIDSRVLFEEKRIRTYQLDQTSDESWNSLLEKISGNVFDLIIDDGLHAPIANLRSVIYGDKLLRKEGVLVIEDVSIQSLPIWIALKPLIAEKFSTVIVKAKLAYLIVLTKK